MTQSTNGWRQDIPYPSTTKTTSGPIHGMDTVVTLTTFSDKIMITIVQEGRLAQWIHVPLNASSPNYADTHLSAPDNNEDSLLPLSHLTPKTLLGGSNSPRETVGQLYATQIASAILTRNPEEKRTVLLGLGLSKLEASREVFYDLIDLVMKII